MVGCEKAKLTPSREMAGVTGLEPATSGVTGRRSNQLSYTPAAPTPRRPVLPPPTLECQAWEAGFSQVFLGLSGDFCGAASHRKIVPVQSENSSECDTLIDVAPAAIRFNRAGGGITHHGVRRTKLSYRQRIL
jgi:hypothetical protein